jgi:hypothetical protein
MLAEKRLAVPVSLTQARMVFNIWNACVYLMENLFVLRLTVLEETSSRPDGVARLAERSWLQMYIAISQECVILTQGVKMRHDILATE